MCKDKTLFPRLKNVPEFATDEEKTHETQLKLLYLPEVSSNLLFSSKLFLKTLFWVAY